MRSVSLTVSCLSLRKERYGDGSPRLRPRFFNQVLRFDSVVYWQAKEIHRVLNECGPEENGVDVSLIEHVSPITWDNVILYGEYVLNRGLVRV